MGRPMFCSCWPGKVSAAMCLSNRASCIPEPRWESIKLKAFTTFSLSNLDQVLLPITEKWKYQYIHNVYLSNKQISAPLRNSVIWFRQVFHRMTLDVNMHLKPAAMVCVNGVRSLKNKLLDATSPTVSYTLCKQWWYKELSSFQFRWKKWIRIWSKAGSNFKFVVRRVQSSITIRPIHIFASLPQKVVLWIVLASWAVEKFSE